ncbi:MAG: hypothetical protein IKQ39_03520 [Oscillospiraceae bacterium]|nr:hypothetical protein [Oscillospiraceae bacterium]
MTALIRTLREKLRGEAGLRIIIALGLSGMALILFSGIRSGAGGSTREAEPPPAASDADAPEAYRTELESRLTALISQMDGIRTATVMVTLSGSAEQVYAEEVKSSKSDRGTQSEASCVITRSGGNESALVAETRYPAVVGVAVLCTGGDHAAVQERVSRAVSTVLGIPAACVYVGRSGSV